MIINGDGYAIRVEGVFVVYKPIGENIIVKLNQETAYKMSWYDPRNGGELISGGSVQSKDSGEFEIPKPPNTPNKDWVIVFREI